MEALQFRKYSIQQDRLLRYASRRRRKDEIAGFIKEIYTRQQTEIVAVNWKYDKDRQAKWIQEASGKLKADRVLTEKVVWALWLLEGLVSSGQSFIFKGGS